MVVNIRCAPRGWERNARYAYIGRAGRGMGGHWGNPVAKDRLCGECGETHHSGGSTLGCYERWLQRRLAQEPTYLEPLRGKILVCFCKPGPCHGDVIERYLERSKEIS